MYPDAALKSVSLRVNRARRVTEKRTGESLEYSAIDIANLRRLIL
jgi:hypothetical protein